jgi:hypothetical protein
MVLSMNLRRVLTLPAIGLLAAAVGCSGVIQKSANPTSPTIAGALDGVTFTAPVNVTPAQNAQIKYTDQPITFAFDSATSTSPRPFTMHLQISKAYAFDTTVFDRGGFEPPTTGSRISFRMADRLPKGIYYWRVRAEDGANNSDWSPPAAFEALDQIIVGAPSPKSPMNNERVTTRNPTLTANDGVSSGPHKALQYEFQLAKDFAFTSVVADGIVGESAGTSSYIVSASLDYDIAYYWRVRASDGDVTSGWSDIAAFASPATPPPTPTPPPAPGGGGGSGSGPVPDGWQNCLSAGPDKYNVVACVHGFVNPGPSSTRAFEVTKRVAWLYRGEGMGLLIKTGGENIISWQGFSFAIGRVCYPDGHIYKVLSDVGDGGTNGPSWSDNDFVDASLYVPAINPNLPEPDALLSSMSTYFEDAILAPPALAARRWLDAVNGLF